ncbi:AraC-like DNA-binding protein [Tamilnaduibacter salinus]|uniref:AraC family transcriptional regulator n=1 Tax=Tamilnaduibacter salinus TaxID=1484056 RepID=A0A2A2I0N5_9GAMM|nr:AraC family transcriptional regulator [Tamilnaduibacter salinus]PAV24705.1 AraC family transcriptional regulator [Tamilnaduibacter salinus]PVY79097.1 AraC-like DNA-binding protein [Tamilnaduibacter salinus]
MSTITVSVTMIEAALRHYPGSEQDAQALCRAHGVPPGLLRRAYARVSAEHYSSLLQAIMVAMGDEMLGYGRVPHRLGTWKIMAHSVITAETLGEALRRYCHFFRLFDWGLAPRLAVEDDEAVLTLTPTDPSQPLEDYAHVATLFYYHRFASWLVDFQIPVLGVDMPADPPVYADELRPMYRYAPIRFGRGVSRMRFAASMLDRSLQQDRLSLETFLENPNLVMVARRFDRDSWQARVRAIIHREPANMPSFEQVASELHLNPQTLRRRLRREGLTFNEIRSQVRRDLAIYHLSRSRDSVETIAYRVGFAEPSNFIRAFRQWTGVTPFTYRKGG